MPRTTLAAVVAAQGERLDTLATLLERSLAARIAEPISAKPSDPSDSKLEAAIVGAASVAERKSRSASRRGGPSQVAKASAEVTPEDSARRHFETVIAMHARTLVAPTATEVERVKAQRVTDRLTYWLLDRGSYVAAMSLWGVATPAEQEGRDARSAARVARKARKVAAPAAPTVTLAELLAMGATVTLPDGRKVSA